MYIYICMYIYNVYLCIYIYVYIYIYIECVIVDMGMLMCQVIVVPTGGYSAGYQGGESSRRSGMNFGIQSL